MTAPTQENQVQESKNNDKELNFRALEQKYQRALEAERSEKERLVQELQQRQKQSLPDDEDDSEPYVDHKKLNRKLNQFGQNQQSEINKAMDMAKHAAKQELKQEMWLENNPDFYDVLKHAEKFAQKVPKLAENILRMPEGFERQQLVYNNIKALGLDQPEAKQSTIQEKIDANKRSPYYQPSGVGAAPYNQVSDYSPNGQKQAYEKMQELKQKLRL
ncbi:MAG TPA: hypothetical protein VFG24_05620 [Nitrosopumilaceae archaeon]|nr:hypothetical protein [Nitrosopumilaceae archaeon]